MSRPTRVGLLITQAFVAVTGLAGGIALVAGSVDPAWASVLTPPMSYLDGSPFRSYLIPGLLLIVVVAGVHAAGFFATIADSSWQLPAAAAGGFACIIWIFVQMVYIPFSLLQAVYVAVGCLELGLTLLALEILHPVLHHHRSTFVPARSAHPRTRRG